MNSNNKINEDTSNPKKKRSFWDIFRIIIIVVAAIVFIYAAYNLITIYLDYKKIDDINAKVDTEVVVEQPTQVIINDEPVEVPFTYDNEALNVVNIESIGYIYVPASSIRLPIVQGEDNERYLTTSITGESSSGGTIFEDAGITGGLSATHVILYGHMMKNGSMFHNLRYYEDYSFFAEAGHDQVFMYTDNSIKEFRIFSVHITGSSSSVYTFNFGNLEQLRNYAKTQKSQSLYDTGVDVTNAEQILTLSTCYVNDISKRFVVQCVLVGESPL